MLAQVALAYLLFAILQTASLSAQTINHTDSRQVAAFPLEQTVLYHLDEHNLVLVEYGGTLESSGDAKWRNERQHTLRESIDRAVDANSIGVRNLGLSRRRLMDYEPALVTDNGTNPQQRKTLEVDWEKIASQVLVFTAIQHGVRLTEEKTRRELAGSWTRDWFVSASSLFARPTWSDSGKFLTNYMFHPMGGSVYAHIYKQNDSLGRTLESGLNREVHHSLCKSFRGVRGLERSVRGRPIERGFHRKRRPAAESEQNGLGRCRCHTHHRCRVDGG